jgi:hypothetical protein
MLKMLPQYGSYWYNLFLYIFRQICIICYFLLGVKLHQREERMRLQVLLHKNLQVPGLWWIRIRF